MGSIDGVGKMEGFFVTWPSARMKKSRPPIVILCISVSAIGNCCMYPSALRNLYAVVFAYLTLRGSRRVRPRER